MRMFIWERIRRGRGRQVDIQTGRQTKEEQLGQRGWDREGQKVGMTSQEQRERERDRETETETETETDRDRERNK